MAHMVKSAVQKAKKLVVGIYGAGGEGSGDGSTLKKYVEDKGGKMFEFYEEGKALDHIKNNHSGKSIEIYGYSRGGNAAISIVNSLGNAGIYVSRLVTFDPHHFWSSTFKLKHRVGKVLNFYQRNPRTGGILGWWGKNPYWGSPIKGGGAYNVNYTGLKNVTHLNIIRFSLNDPLYNSYNSF
ncbi:hypothetical protein JL193_09540 [Polaribacter batillariae]|uniref:DUF2235 domain-containing protein n=1 Tax=Polaribacter batillariae TaxID=2808900 RepID=A0ABX7SRB5_9FLAO|nr:hypothetical protein [Polaribacter batillariae]QTD36402.1 hypothetical protein JL193_09540 [Polaribacter batillariae]